MLPDRVSNPGPLTYESDALIALRGPAIWVKLKEQNWSLSEQLLSVMNRPCLKCFISKKNTHRMSQK